MTETDLIYNRFYCIIKHDYISKSNRKTCIMKKIIFVFVLVFSAFISALCLTTDVSATDMSFTEYLNSKVNNMETLIEISQYVNDNKWTVDDMRKEITTYYLTNPQLFFVKNNFKIGKDSASNRYYVEFSYKYSKSETNKMKKKLDSEVKKIIKGIDSKMSDVEKALYVYDYLILNCAYDFEVKSFNAYDCIVNKKAVCQGYSLAYMLILKDYLGIDCTIVLSDSQNHSWNYVKIDGKWYHADLTSDDSTFIYQGGKEYDVFGKACHDNFLISDEKCKKTSGMHRDWKVMGGYGAADSTLYDNAEWHGCRSPMQYYNGKWYYVVYEEKDDKQYSKIYSYDFKSNKSELISKVATKWYLYRDPSTGEKLNPESKFYKASYTRLAKKGKYLYFNTSMCIYRVNLKTNETKRIYTLNKKKGQQIYGIALSGLDIRVCYKYDTSYKDNYLKLKLS